MENDIKPDPAQALFDQQTDELLKKACDLRVWAYISYHSELPELITILYEYSKTAILIRGLEPAEDARHLRSPSPIKVSFSYENRGMFKFDSVFLGSNGVNYYLIQYPTELIRIQRRNTYRVVPAQTLSAQCVSISDKNTKDRVKVENISQEGVRLTFPNKVDLPIGSRIVNIKLQLPGNREVQAHGVVRSIIPDGAEGCSIGIKWVFIDSEAYRILTEYVGACQRKEAKTKLRF